MKRAVFLDLDGTLIDPRQGITASICYALDRMGRPVPEQDSLLWCIGPPLQRSLVTLLGTDDKEMCDRALAFYRERYRDIGIYEFALYDGVREAMGRLRSDGHATYLATSKPTVFARTIVEHVGIGGLLDGVFGSELTGERVDKADLLGYALETLGLQAGISMMVGDREHDVVGATANAMPCIGVTYGYGSREELTSAGAATLVDHPSQIPAACLELAQTDGDSRCEPQRT